MIDGASADTRIVEIGVKAFQTISRSTTDSGGHRHPGPPREVTQALVYVTDSDGETGYCLAQKEHVRPSIVEGHARPALVGGDPFAQGRLWKALAHRQRGAGGALTDRGIGYFDQALWDLAGRKLGLPVWKLLGGARTSVPAYASTMCGDEGPAGLATPRDYASYARELVGSGYQAIKLHTWMPPVSFAPSVDRDIEACSAVRDAVGPNISLMLDANHWYSRTDALRLGRALDELGYHWYEEPMEEASIGSYRWLSSRLSTPVIGPESAWGKHLSRAEWVSSGACSILRAGANDVGGITPALKVIHLAEAFNVSCEIHGASSGNLALVTGAGAGTWYERALMHPQFDYDTPAPHLNTIIDPVDVHGRVHAPITPGLGDDLNLDYIDDHIVETW